MRAVGDAGAVGQRAHRWLRACRERPIGRSAAIGAAVVGLVTLIVVDDLGYVPLGPNRSLRVLLEGFEAAIGGLVALLVYGRLRVSRSSSDALLVASLALTAGTSLVVALGLSMPPALPLSPLEAAIDWGALGVRSIAAACLVVAAVGPERRMTAPPAPAMVIGALAVPAVAVLGARAMVHTAGLPLGPVRASGADGSDLTAHPALEATQAVLVLAWAASSIGFVRRGQRTDDRFILRLGVVAGLGTVARLQFLLVPSLYSDAFRVGDVVRFADYVVLLAAAVAEIRSYWAAEAVALAERERQRLARTVHDGLVQELSFLQAHAASAAAGRAHPGLAEHVRAATDRAYAESRRLLDILDAPPLSMEDDGASALDSLQRLRTEVQMLAARAGVDTEVQWSAAHGRDHREAAALHQIAREAVANALRHGRPRRVWVTVWPEPTCALRVVDDGVGIGQHPTTGFGHRAMADLAHGLDAEMWIGPADGGGTAVEVRRR